MSIINYFFIGIVVTFLVDLLLYKLKYHPKIKNAPFGWTERVMCILGWPIAIIVFSLSFFKEFFKNK